MAQRTQDAFGANLRTRITDLSPAKRELLGQRLKQRSRDAVPNQGILRPRTASPTLLSFAQQRLWFLNQYESNSSVYNIPSALRLKGTLNVGALEHSLNEIVRRHESFRTTFSTVEGEPVQVISPTLNVSLSGVDLRETAESEREDKSRRRVDEEARRPFDLARGPLFRATLIRLGDDDHILVLTMHHIVSDGWSMGVLFQELSVLYGAFSRGKPPALPDLPIQYADFASWQRGWLQGEVLDRQLSYWKKQLDGIPAVLNLPTDRPRPPVQSYRGARQSIELSKELTDGLNALSRKEGVTLFMTLLAAFQTLLYRYTGQEDIVVGSPIANRNRTEIEGLIGFFVNTLVLRSNFSDNPTFMELLTRVKETTLGAYEHQDLPFEKLVEEVKPERSLSHSPLFQVMFALQNAPTASLSFEGLRTNPVPTGAETVKFDLTLSIGETVHGLKGSLRYSTELFDEATIARMIGHWRTLLEGAVANPDQRICRLPMLTPAETHQLLVEWNDTKRAYRTDRCIHELFEEQVEKTPSTVAVTFEDQQLTYRELNHRANQLAHYLKRLGVTAETVVGICLDRSLEMVIGVLGILKAGSAYLPLDPNYPKDRLGFMLEDSRASIILTKQRFVEQFRHDRHTLVCLDAEWEKIAREGIANLMSSVTPDNLAYVLYTSGSTGAPKGVMIEHESVVNYLSWFNQAEMAAGLQSFPFVTNLVFDASLKQLFGPLLRANSVRILSDEAISQPSVLLEALRACSGFNCAPTLWSSLLDTSNWKEIFPSIDRLSVLLLGGEPLTNSLIDRTFTVVPHAEIWNFYGPTETTANAIVGRVTPDQTITLGRPIANTQIYLLDSNLQPVPAGVPGEIYVGGVGLARGYLNRPELTAEKFLPNPFSKEPDARLYKTGDLACYRTDGNIQFLGRVDDQVKIRGFRIELGEIQAVLAQHPEVREAIVLAREDRPGDKRLVAYVVPAYKQFHATGELRNVLKKKLPDYMVPSAFVFLDGLPLTSNGKIDRMALPVPEGGPELVGYVAPRSPVEEMIAEVWAEVLRLDRVGVHDNFFELGGHSLLATQVVSRICQALRVEIPLRALFERPTVAELAKHFDQTRSEEGRLSVPPILAVSRDRDLPLSFAQERLWFLDQYEPNSSVYNLPSALRLKGSLNVEALEQSLNEIVRRHEGLRTTFRAADGEPVQVIAPSLAVPLSVVDLRETAESEREEESRRFVGEQARRPFDLARGPLFRASLIRLGQDDQILVLTMHHIVSDGWSMGVLYRELSVLYAAFSRGKPSPLPELPIQYADFTAWQRDWLQGEVLERQISYWKKQLEGIPALLNLPTDHPRPAVQSHRGGRQSFVLSRELSRQLKDLSRKEGVTLFMTLLAAFQTLLHRYSGQEDVMVGSPIANRDREEIERLIGFFVNTLVLRTDLSNNPSFREVLKRVREVCLEAYAHQEVPFQKVVESLHPKRDSIRRSLGQVAFAFQNVPRQPLKLPGLTVTPVRTDLESAKIDLTLFMWETEEGLAGSLNYAADLFDAVTISRMMEHFQTLLSAVVGDPERRLLDLPRFLERSRSELLEAIHRATEQSWHFETDATAGREQGEL